MENEKKGIAYERNGVRNHFKEEQIQHFSSDDRKWPECEGWKRVPKEVLQAEKKEQGKVVGMNNTNLNQSNQDKKQSANEVIGLINQAQTVEAIEELTNGDTRATVLKAKESRISELLELENTIQSIMMCDSIEAVNEIANGDERIEILQAKENRLKYLQEL